jgi:hypothetical protein
MFLAGCQSKEPPQPAQFWGGIGFSYETNKFNGDTPTAATHIGFEKQLGDGVGIGAEVSGVAH